MGRRTGFDWFELIIGILLILLGVFTFANPGFALTGFVMMYGVVAIVMGVSDIVLYVRVERYTGFGPMVALIFGILSVMSGVMLIVYPDAGSLIISILFPIWFIAHCISRLSHMHMVRITAGKAAYYLMLIANIAGLVLGIMMFIRPWISLLSVSYIISLYLLSLGIDSIVIAFSNMRPKI